MILFKKGSRLTFIMILLSLVYLGKCTHQKPNIVIFLADDLGFGDLQPFGNPLSYTPNINELVRDGLKFTQFYSTSPMCSPSRAGLLTGRYPVRTGVWNNVGNPVFLQENIGGLPHEEIVIPEMLATQGYKSVLVGKWQLGVGRNKEFLPLTHGFDHYFGVPCSHEDCPCIKCSYPDDTCYSQECDNEKAPCQLLLDNDIIEQPVDLITLAERQARAARSWIQEYSCTGTPMFLLYSFLHPHYPQFAGKRHRNSTIGGAYTYSLAELDWQVGEVMDELKKRGMIDNTLVLFTSDNGPDLNYKELGGFSGVFRCGKSSTFEGGSRVPTIAYWPGRIRRGISTEFLSHLDIWPTIRSISGVSPDLYDIILDGYDMSNVLFNNSKSARTSMLYYGTAPDPDIGPLAVRSERYKAHYVTECSHICDPDHVDEMCRAYSPTTFHDPPLLFNILFDPEERHDISNMSDYRQVLDMLSGLFNRESSDVTFHDSVLKAVNPLFQLCCNTGCQPFPTCCQCASNYTNELLPLHRECKLHNLRVDQYSGRKTICRKREQSK